MLWTGCTCLLLMMAGGCTPVKKKAPVSLTWQMSTRDVGKGWYENSFVLKNNSDAPLTGDWAIYFSQHPRKIQQDDDAPVRVQVVNATHCKMTPAEGYAALAPGDSLSVVYRCRGEVPNRSMIPESPYWVVGADGEEQQPLAVSLMTSPLPTAVSQNASAGVLYESNRRILAAMSDEEMAVEVIPAVKQAVRGEGVLQLQGRVAVETHADFSTESRLLQEKLISLYGLQVDASADVRITLQYLPEKAVAVNEEYYELTVSPAGVCIAAATAHGVFNGTQTLLALLKGQQSPYVLSAVAIKDYPDLLYRGQMLDIARNFVPVTDVKKLIDVLASYKLNTFHFHFSDDEGWRLEIPGLEELTDVSSRRGHTMDETDCLYPAYDGHYDPLALTTGNGYYTREAFIDLLRYAAERHVNVIPEIESPGHARAAIVAMKARYRKYMATDSVKACEYLLNDWQDSSVYRSAQWYTDNVMNVALPSTYRFMEKVIAEVKQMYVEAGVPLVAVQIGGDEVANGAWMGSPKCKELMQAKSMTQPRELSEYFVKRVIDCLAKQHIPFGGWQEVAMGRSKETDAYLSEHASGIYCWKTTTKDGMDEIVYKMANKGYPVILCNVTNFYMDLAYEEHPDEPGHYWGGYVNEAKSFSALPYSVYRSIRTNLMSDKEHLGTGKTRLTEEGRKQIKGVQGTLFAETIRDYRWVEYYLFPKLMGLAERGWLASPAWETAEGEKEQQLFEQDLAFYYKRIAEREMPYWQLCGINYRLPYPGIRIENDTLYANTPIRGAEIRYTTDGTEPVETSMLWQSPVSCPASTVKAKLFCHDKQSVTVTVVQ